MIRSMENKHKRNRTKLNIMNWLKAEFVKRRYGFNSPVLWTPHIRCFNDLRFRKNVILTSISVGIGHISQKGWGQDSKSQRGRGDAPGTSAGTLAALIVVSSGRPLAERPLESFALWAFYTLQTAVLHLSGGDDTTCPRGGADEAHTQSTRKPIVWQRVLNQHRRPGFELFSGCVTLSLKEARGRLPGSPLSYFSNLL